MADDEMQEDPVDAQLPGEKAKDAAESSEGDSSDDKEDDS